MNGMGSADWLLWNPADQYLIVPLVKLTMSLAAGTPVGDQLPGLNQSMPTEPVQVRLVWADATPKLAIIPTAIPRQQTERHILSGESGIQFQVCRIIARKRKINQRMFECAMNTAAIQKLTTL